MHVLNLYIGYGIGLKDNVKTEMAPDGKRSSAIQQVTKITTPGGPFEGGAVAIKKMCTLINYSTGERRSALQRIQEVHGLPELGPFVDVDVRVASACKLMRRSLVKYTAFSMYFQQKPQLNVFRAVTTWEWQLIREMEAVTFFLSELAMAKVQKETLVFVHAPLSPECTRVFEGRLFSLHDADTPLSRSTTAASHPRTDTPVEQFFETVTG